MADDPPRVRSPRRAPPCKKTPPRAAAPVSPPPTSSSSSSLPAPSPKRTTHQARRNYLFYWKNGKPPPSTPPPPKKPNPNRRARSSFSRRSRSSSAKIPATAVANDLVVPFTKPKSRPSLYPRIPSPWVPRLGASDPRPGDARTRAVFWPRDGREAGVSVRRCLENRLGEEVARASESIASLVPPAWRARVAQSLGGYLVINWSSPATTATATATATATSSARFESPQIEYEFSFVRPDGAMMSVGEFIGQIANIYDFWFRCDFNRLYKNKFSIRADTMRLRELILVDEEEDLWKVEAGF